LLITALLVYNYQTRTCSLLKLYSSAKAELLISVSAKVTTYISFHSNGKMICNHLSIHFAEVYVNKYCSSVAFCDKPLNLVHRK